MHNVLVQKMTTKTPPPTPHDYEGHPSEVQQLPGM